MRKRFFAIFLMLALAAGAAGCGKPKVVTYETAIEQEVQVSQTLVPLTQEMANVYSSYLAFNTTEAEFKRMVKGMQERYNDLDQTMNTFYEKYSLNADAPPKTKDALTKIQEARQSVGNILRKTMQGDQVSSRADILKAYLEENKKTAESLSKFKQLISEQYGNAAGASKK